MQSRTSYIDRILKDQQESGETLRDDFNTLGENDPQKLSADMQAGVSARLDMALGFANDEYEMEIEEGNLNAFNILTEEYAAGRAYIMGLDGITDAEQTSMLRSYDDAAGEFMEVEVLDAQTQIQTAGNTLLTQLDTIVAEHQFFDPVGYMMEQQANGEKLDMNKMQKLEDASHAAYIDQIRPIHDQIMNIAELAQRNGVELDITPEHSEILEAVNNYDLAQEELQAQDTAQQLDNNGHAKPEVESSISGSSVNTFEMK